MIDLVPSFRQLGSRVLFAQVSRQKSKLSIALAQMPSYNSEVDEQSFVKIESFLKKILFEFTQLGSLWRNVLPTSLPQVVIMHQFDASRPEALALR